MEKRTVREQAAKEQATEKQIVREDAAKNSIPKNRLPYYSIPFESLSWPSGSRTAIGSQNLLGHLGASFLLESLWEMEQSFFWQLMWLMFYHTFGITSLVVVWTLLPPLEQWSLSYGQLVPVVSFIFAFPPLYDDFQGESLDQRSIAYGADHDTEEDTDKSQVAVPKSPLPAGSGSRNKAESDTNELVAQSSHDQDHKPSYPSWRRDTDVGRKTRVRLEAFNVHKKDEGFTQVSR